MKLQSYFRRGCGRGFCSSHFSATLYFAVHGPRLYPRKPSKPKKAEASHLMTGLCFLYTIESALSEQLSSTSAQRNGGAVSFFGVNAQNRHSRMVDNPLRLITNNHGVGVFIAHHGYHIQIMDINIIQDDS